MGAAVPSLLMQSSTLTGLSTAFSVMSTFSQMNAQRAALARENQRIEMEAKMAELAATQDENNRMDAMYKTLGSNLAFQAVAGYYDDSRSFLNIQDQTVTNAEKDIANIRLMGSSVQSKLGQLRYENTMKSQDLVFGGWTSIGGKLTTGYQSYLDEKSVEDALD
jgi:hypothetical protein